jgi:hypothetical protein
MSSSTRKSLVILASLALLTAAVIWSQPHATRAAAFQDAGPAIGDTVDLKSWTDRTGRTLAEVNGRRSLALVAFVTPNCDTCAKAKDAMDSLRERAGKANIAYYVVVIPNGADPQSYFSYADSLKIGAEAFVWSNAETKPPATLSALPAPFHLMLTNEGLVVNKWAGVPSSVSTQ